jgi:probable HAF family extracellular repeat protein
LDVLIDFVPGTYEPTLRLIPRPEVVFTPIVAIAADFEPIHFPGALMSAALGINDQGVIVGQSFDPDTDPEFPDAFQLTGGTYSAVDVPGVQFFVADDVNNHGHIVGTGEDQDGVRHGYMVTPQGHMTIHFPGADWTGASGINDQGMVVGQFGSSTEPASAFLFDGNEYTRIELPQGRAIVATDINNANQVIGTFEDEMGRRRGFVTSDLSTFERIEFPGGRGTSLLSINDSGLIVGQTDIPGIDPQQDAFLFDGVFYTEINLPGVNATSAQGINNFGQIVGNYDTADGQTRGFLIDVSQLVIIPEPSALALVVAAAGIVAIAWRRVRKGFARPTRMT